MAGAKLPVTLTVEDEGVVNRLQQLLAQTGDLRPAFRDIGAYLLRAERARFAAQTDPQGRPWAPLSPVTVARKRKNKGLKLVLDGYLKDTMRYQITPTSIEFGTDRKYGATHQFGARKGEFGATRRGGPIPWGDIPARPFLGLSGADRGEILDIIGEHIAGRA